MSWLPAEAPAVVTLIAPLPAVGVAAVALVTLPIVARESSDGVVWLKLDGGAQIVGEAIDDATPLGVLLPLDDAWPIRLAAADRLRRKIAGLPVTAPLTRHRRERLKCALRTIDGRRAGASYRALATVLFGARRVSAEHWKTGSLKAQVARLAAYGRMLIDRGYRKLLRAGKGRRPK